MGIPYRFDPLGTLGGVELLDSVHVACAADEPLENLVTTAFGGNYYLEPFGSSGYFAEVEVEHVNGTNVGRRSSLVSIGAYSSTQIGSLILYSYGTIADTLDAHPQCYDAISVREYRQFTTAPLYWTDGKINNFSLRHSVERNVYSGSATGRTVSDNLGSWTALQNVRMPLLINKIPGLSYDFKRLAAHTENVKFDALPARRAGADGIAFFIDDRLTKFIKV